MNLNDIGDNLGAAAAALLAAAIGARKYLRRDRAEVASDSSYGMAITNMREEIERLAKLNETLHIKIINYQKETLDLHDKLEKISMEMIIMAQENEGMKNEMRAMRDRLHRLFNSCGSCHKVAAIENFANCM